ncbi:alpha-amylase family protein [Pseudocnuella soli]|uniref:alpha-amylase family protein n=1 Tax=Pseudocnuella soli TaxID=2502779 RepID=UPI00104DB81A|nr:alpha-amylase family protein [Pseudocnuella soli]
MTDELWYKNAVIYSLDLETFMDANGDGIGDFEGLCDRLHYLHALGVDTIWLAPFQPTPNKDNGYDVQDYYGVDPRHGSNGDFVSFMHQAKKLGIKVIIDLVVNHTSDQHPWFKNARSSKDAPYRNWYVWADKRPSNWDEGMVFPGVQKATWTKDKQTGAYYHHRFYPHQPDLNTHNPEVRKEIRKIMGYWLQLGVSGFRVDAVPFILEMPQPGKKNPVMKFEYLEEMRNFLQWRSGDAVLLGEANVLPEQTKNYFGERAEGIHMMFNFYVNQYSFYTLATGDTAPLIKALEDTRVAPGISQWANFLRNHDELDIDRLPDDLRQRVFEQFGPEQHMQLYDRGIRRRLAPMLGSRAKIELAYSLMFSLPGTPVMRYGDEIGMGDDLDLKERDAVRTPMQWCAEEGAGFSTAPKLVHPVIDKGFYSYQHVNVADQRRDPQSLLNWMTSLIRLRKECPEIGMGNWEILDAGVPTVLAMRYSWKGNAVMMVHNFGDKPVEIKLPATKGASERLDDLMDQDSIEGNSAKKFTIGMTAYGYRWFRVKTL